MLWKFKKRKSPFEKDVARSVEKLHAAIEAAPDYTCPICGYKGKFAPYGLPVRLNARCPSCRAMERHRHLYLYFDREKPFGAKDEVLHFAPEAAVRRMIEPVCGTYRTADLMAEEVDLKLNIEAIDLPGDSYTGIICNHVLEHVDDAKALAEIYRILKPGGLAVLTTPVCEGWDETYENADVSPGAEAMVHFGQHDHVRYYGRDVRDRIRAAGFSLEERVAREPEVHLYSLLRGNKIFLARKPA